MKRMNTIHFCKLNVDGDTKLELSWDPKNKKEVEHMKQFFKDLRSQGYMIFEMEKKFLFFERKGKEIQTFDDSLGKMIAELPSEVKVEQIETGREESLENGEYFDPDNDEVKDGKTYITTPTIIGG